MSSGHCLDGKADDDRQRNGRSSLSTRPPSRRPIVAAALCGGSHEQDEVSTRVGLLLRRHLDTVFEDITSNCDSLSGVTSTLSVDAGQIGAANPLQPTDRIGFNNFRLFAESPCGAVGPPFQESCVVEGLNGDDQTRPEARRRLKSEKGELRVGNFSESKLVYKRPTKQLEPSGEDSMDALDKTRVRKLDHKTTQLPDQHPRANVRDRVAAGPTFDSSSDDDDERKRLESVVVSYKATDF
jgi:hypothetical protein